MEVKSYAAIVPYNYEVLAASNARQLMTSYEVLGGAHTLNAVWATETWVKENPKTYQAVMAAFEEATELITKDREIAARTYAKWEASTLPTADVARIIGTPSDITFSVVPNRTLMIAETMHKVGLLKTKPAAWSEPSPCGATWQERIVIVSFRCFRASFGLLSEGISVHERCRSPRHGASSPYSFPNED